MIIDNGVANSSFSDFRVLTVMLSGPGAEEFFRLSIFCSTFFGVNFTCVSTDFASIESISGIDVVSSIVKILEKKLF